ncbi:vacuolar transporter chaperone, putative [Plasmodium knowlesi strain H]|uniref:Vacuolar transporter chaperone, putative n=3 Tax=Plasmodium knowlesi TaxID=5850 RepID=A0A5K1VC24_PLAKH|nr:vacuolar transporter chaperone, putative [Plasmodium knowlesi strain H]OTN64768.1 putative Vacuolar transporter chaperone [Plasmodium knowlesi]CAA9989107.1 vacuolar transporter chaperone, putative [Plasmodium knowlesi strain H]SBO27322.1 vacuolar transporter chaperone, putative [Plasmodium knowlesi strain H]SBO28946.1 vacuolar transporter chaperone, putative [Plasmodium knowlesi strain H]VVS78581.1 vacuolar transporter chaperone, putative [Plasmodium knowlesi strain H]|eukprot:XP_002261454.1 hypothetical protein, conserved in Plasmodium species [Plasmodium knowlesi strain H]
MVEVPRHYRKYYVSYKKIKRTIVKMGHKYRKKLEKDLIQSAARRVDEQGIKLLPPFLFNDLITQEIKKINKFSEKKYNEIIDILMSTYEELKSIDLYSCKKEKEEMEKKIDLIGCDIVHFDFYIHKNCKILMKLGFYFDHVMNISINQWLLLGLIKEKFCNINVDELVVYLSVLYALHRSRSETSTYSGANAHIDPNEDNLANPCNAAPSPEGKTWVPPETFERTSTKFLMKYEDIVYTKVKIVKHLPYLIFGLSNQDLEEHFRNFGQKKNKKLAAQMDGELDDTHEKNKPLNESQQITSVYLDNEEATCYSNRILRYENAQLIRFRWYNDNDGNPDKTIFIERKIHHEEWTGEISTKERFELQQKYVFKFMTGQMDVPKFFQRRRGTMGKEGTQVKGTCVGNLEKKLKKNEKLAMEIQAMITKNQLEPIIRTSYLRSAFQLSDDNSIRISIDTNVSMLNEYVRKREHWCRLAEEALRKNEIRRLNYAIIEVKLKVEKIPQWVQDILNSNHFINAYKYSKYQTAMALLHPEKIKYIPVWIHSNVHEKFKPNNNYAESVLTGYSSCGKGDNTNADSLQASVGVTIENAVTVAKGASDCQEIIHLQGSGDPPVKRRNKIYANGYIQQMTNPSSHQSLEKWNILDKTSLWLSHKYSRNKNAQEKIDLLKIDPKINFAAERTFLHYSLVSVYITLLALFLEKYKNENEDLDLVIILLLATSFSSLISSYFLFLKRIEIIDRRKTKEPLLGRRRFDSFYSPLIFLILLFFSIILSIYFNFNVKAIKVASWTPFTFSSFPFRVK